MKHLPLPFSPKKVMGKLPYLPPAAMLNGKTMFVPYIFTDEELTELFKMIDDCYVKSSERIFAT